MRVTVTSLTTLAAAALVSAKPGDWSISPGQYDQHFNANPWEGLNLCTQAFMGNETDYDVAQNMLKQWCDTGAKVAPCGTRSFTYGTAQAYICSFGGENGCSSAEIEQYTEWFSTSYHAPRDCWRSGRGYRMQIGKWHKAFGVVENDGTDLQHDFGCLGWNLPARTDTVECAFRIPPNYEPPVLGTGSGQILENPYGPVTEEQLEEHMQEIGKGGS